MASKKEEERNEKIIRGLMKLPPNRRCINCNSLGPQYVCTNFWTFICTTCSGIHREFTHRVKSISMAKFTSQEVEALQRGGNQRAREIFLKEWDTQRRKLPDSSNVDKIREFIKTVYVDRKYAAVRSSDKPPRDMQSSKNQEDEYRRASSYHSFSQSPPYEHQYEDRRYGKPPSVLTRKGSDRGQYDGKFSSFAYSSGQLGGKIMFEDRFANEGTGSRVSDYSASSTSDPFRDVQSPNFQKDIEFGRPPVQPIRDVLGDAVQLQTKRDVDAITRPQRTASSGSFGSFDSNSRSLNSVNSGGLVDSASYLEPSAGARSSVSTAASQEPFNASFIQPLASSLAAPIDLFADATHLQPSIASLEKKPSVVSANAAIQGSFHVPFMQQLATSSVTSVDLFADATHLQPSTSSLEQKPSEVSISESGGWATFDLPHHVAPTPTQTNNITPALVTSGDGLVQGNLEGFSSLNNSLQWASGHNPTDGPFSFTAIQLPGLAYEVQAPVGPTSSQFWNAFDNSDGSFPSASSENLKPKNEYLGEAHQPPPPPSNQDTNSRSLEEPGKGGFQRSVVEELVAAPTLPVNGGVSGSLFPSPELASMVEPCLVSQEGFPSNAHDRKSTNPFDLPYDSEVESCNMFLNMGSLQAALPNPPVPAFLNGLNTSWFPQNPVPQFMPAVPQGLAYVGGQAPTSQLPNLASQGSVVPLGGNPFA